jgi:hypothetical protein
MICDRPYEPQCCGIFRNFLRVEKSKFFKSVVCVSNETNSRGTALCSSTADVTKIAVRKPEATTVL